MRWWHWAMLIVAFQYVIAFALGSATGFYHVLPIAGLARAIAFLSTLTLFGFSFACVAYFAVIKEKEPLNRLWRELRRATEFPIAMALFFAQMLVLQWLKMMLPKVVGFWADPLLANLDALIFFGDPWRWLHLLPVGGFLDHVYLTWGFAVAGCLCVLIFIPESPRRSAAFVSYFLLMGISSLGQYLLPSAGPIYYAAIGLGDRFADLPVQPLAKATASHLWASFTSETTRVGVGISAMPSVHVAGAAWLALVIGSYLPPRARPFGWVYFALIIVGSVYLGWHYAVDGLAGLVVALIAYRFARRLSCTSGTEWQNEQKTVRVSSGLAS